MTYSAADVASNGGVAWVRQIAAGMDPSGIETQIQGYAAAQSVLQAAATTTTKGQNTLTASWGGQAAQAAQQQFSTTAQLHTKTADTIQQVMIGLSNASASQGAFIQTVLGPAYQVGQMPDPTEGIPLEVPVPIITDQQSVPLVTNYSPFPPAALTPFQARQNAVAHNQQVQQQAADALNELAFSYATAQSYFNQVSSTPAEGFTPTVNTTAFALGPAPAGTGKTHVAHSIPTVHNNGTIGGGTSLQGTVPLSAPVTPTAPIIGSNSGGGTIPGGGTGPGSGLGPKGVFIGSPITGDGLFGDGDGGDTGFGTSYSRTGSGDGSGADRSGSSTGAEFQSGEGPQTFAPYGAGSAPGSPSEVTSSETTGTAGAAGASASNPIMAGGLGQGMAGAGTGDGSAGQRLSGGRRGRYFDAEEPEEWLFPQPGSVYEGATDQHGRPIDAFNTRWNPIRNAARQVNDDKSELDGPW